MESVRMKTENETQKIERIILDSATVAVIKNISDQINLELGDLVQVTQKSVANFVIRKRLQLLSAQEMSEFLSENYDLVKALKHATQEAIKAKQNGDNIQISDVLKLIQTPSVKSELVPNKARGRKKKTDSSSAADGSRRVDLITSNAAIESVNNDQNFANQDSNLRKNRTSANTESP
jgi:hypothetical protein